MSFHPLALSLELRHATAEAHRRTEASPLMSALMGDTFSLALYQRLLSQMLMFYAPMEERLAACSFSMPAGYVPKTPLLQHDLHHLHDQTTCTPSASPPLPKIENLAAFTGILYVLEGSTLGGALITKHLEKHMDTNASARFFYPYGTRTKQQWDITRSLIDSAAETLNFNHDDAITAAIETFNAIGTCLNAA